MKHAMYFALGGAILVAALTAWLAPGMIAWYFNPPVEMDQRAHLNRNLRF